MSATRRASAALRAPSEATLPWNMRPAPPPPPPHNTKSPPPPAVRREQSRLVGSGEPLRDALQEADVLAFEMHGNDALRAGHERLREGRCKLLLQGVHAFLARPP